MGFKWRNLMLKDGLLKTSYILSMGGWGGGAYKHQSAFENRTLYLTFVSYNINKFLEKSDRRLLFKLKHGDHPGTYCKDSSE